MRCHFCNRLRRKAGQIVCCALFGLSAIQGNTDKPETLDVDRVAHQVLKVSAQSGAALAMPPRQAYPWSVLEQWWQAPPVYRQPRVQIASLLTDVSSGFVI